VERDEIFFKFLQFVKNNFLRFVGLERGEISVKFFNEIKYNIFKFEREERGEISVNITQPPKDNEARGVDKGRGYARCDCGVRRHSRIYNHFHEDYLSLSHRKVFFKSCPYFYGLYLIQNRGRNKIRTVRLLPP
jgi:hypothetical protein